jgi:hypothetical protein
MSERADIFEGGFDVSGFAPKTRKAPESNANTEAIRAVSEKSSFRSREPGAKRGGEISKREIRRYTTGRNVQLNLKARPQAIDLFYKIADSENWVLGEAFEKGVEALNRELMSAGRGVPGKS